MKTRFRDYRLECILLITALVIHLFLPIQWADDAVFSRTTVCPLMEFLSTSSRHCTDALTWLFIRNPLLWRLTNPFVLVATLLMLCRLLPIRCNSLAVRGVACAVLYPTMVIVDAGFIATTVNYLFCIAAGLFCMFPIKYALCGKACPKRMLWFIPVMICYACNMQQMSVVLFGALVIANVVLAFNRSHSWLLWLMTLLTAACMACSVYLNTMTESSRMMISIKTFFPNFAELSLFQKIELGFSSTFFSLTAAPYFVWPFFILFTSFLAMMMWRTSPSPLFRCVSLIPPGASLLLGGLSWTPFFSSIMGELHNPVMSKAVYAFEWLPDALFLLIATCVVITVWNLTTTALTRTVALSALVLGAASRMIMGFSPTVWASGCRTFALLLVCFVFIAMILVSERGHVTATQEQEVTVVKEKPPVTV